MRKQIEARVRSKKASSQAWEAERRKQSEQTRRMNTSKEAVDKMTQKRKEVSEKLAGYAEMLTKQKLERDAYLKEIADKHSD